MRKVAENSRRTATMRSFFDWAKAQGAEEINVHAVSGIEPEHTDRFLRKLGFKPYGGNYAVRLG